MIIDETNTQVGNKAMAAVLLLYYHLVIEGGFTHSQTVYLDADDFNGFDFLDVDVRDQIDEEPEIDQALLREGAVIYLLCELHDVLGEFEADYHDQPYLLRVVEALEAHRDAPIPEVGPLLDLVAVPEADFDYPAYNEILQGIYTTNVRGFWSRMLER